MCWHISSVVVLEKWNMMTAAADLKRVGGGLYTTVSCCTDVTGKASGDCHSGNVCLPHTNAEGVVFRIGYISYVLSFLCTV